VPAHQTRGNLTHMVPQEVSFGAFGLSSLDPYLGRKPSQPAGPPQSTCPCQNRPVLQGGGKGVSLLKKQCSVKALRSRTRHVRVMCGTTMSTHARAAQPCEHRAYTTSSFAHVCHHCVAPTRELRVAHDQALVGYSPVRCPETFLKCRPARHHFIARGAAATSSER
jgi:hypothetical protein